MDNPIHQISEEIDRFYERTFHWPDFVLVGRMEWARIGALTGSCGSDDISVFAACGKVPVRYTSAYYSTIAAVLEEMP